MPCRSGFVTTFCDRHKTLSWVCCVLLCPICRRGSGSSQVHSDGCIAHWITAAVNERLPAAARAHSSTHPSPLWAGCSIADEFCWTPMRLVIREHVRTLCTYDGDWDFFILCTLSSGNLFSIKGRTLMTNTIVPPDMWLSFKVWLSRFKHKSVFFRYLLNEECNLIYRKWIKLLGHTKANNICILVHIK